MNELFHHLKELEISLHQYCTRSNTDKIESLLHADFVEFGYSGKTHDYKSTLRNLLSEEKSEIAIWAQSFEYSILTPEVVQLRYLSANINGNADLSRHAKRSSIWVLLNGSWQLKFHQATPTGVFLKSNA